MLRLTDVLWCMGILAVIGVLGAMQLGIVFAGLTSCVLTLIVIFALGMLFS